MARPARKKAAAKKAPAKKPSARQKRQQAADKTAMRAIQDLGVARALSATQAEMSQSFAGTAVHMHKAIARYFDALPELTERQVLLAHRIAVQSGQTVAALNEAPPLADGPPLPQPGDDARIIDGQALPPQPPGMIEYMAELARKKGTRGDG